MLNNNESENNIVKQQFDIGTYFTIQYYAKKHNKTVTRRGKWTEDCEENTHKVFEQRSFIIWKLFLSSVFYLDRSQQKLPKDMEQKWDTKVS